MTVYPRGKLSALGRAALSYARAGVPVFRLRPGTKEPFHGSRGFHDATADLDTVWRWWNECPDANIGIPTGRPSGLLVLDVDNFTSLDALKEEHGELPPTSVVKTGSGGMHLYLKYPIGEPVRNSAGKLGPGLDIRGKGGYVVAPGSATKGPYEWLERRPLADAPARLLETLRAPSEARSGTDRGHDRPVVSVDPAGGPLPEGSRNAALTRIAGRLHDGTRNREALEADLLKINTQRCSPPLTEREVSRIAASIHGRKACKRSAPKADPEVLEILDGVEAGLWAVSWPGMGWKTARSVMVAVLKEARLHGTRIPAGVRVSIGVRPLALAAGASKRSTDKAIRRLREAGMVRRDDADRSGTQAGTLVLVAPRAKVAHSSTELRPMQESTATSTENASGLPLRAPFSAPRLRWSAPRFDRVGDEVVRSTIRRMGKTCEAVVDVLEASGGSMTLQDLAATLGMKRHRDLRRKRYGAVTRLEEATVVECSGDTVRLCADWLDALDRERDLAGEIEAHRRDMARYDREREAYRTPDRPEKAPTTEEMDHRRETAPDRRRRAVETALVLLFRDRPEYRGRRVGQIVCELIRRLPEDFPRGIEPGGAPKDAEVAAILESNGADVAA